MSAMAGGDQRAAALVYDQHSALVFGIALRMMGQQSDAEEVTLEVFAQVWRDAARYDASRATVVGWLTTITRTRALDAIRAQRRRERLVSEASTMLDEPAAMSEAPVAPDVAVDEGERATAVASALEELPPAQRRAIELAFFEGLSHPEVAARLAEPLGTVKTRIRLGMHKLRTLLAGMAPEGAR